MKDETLDHTLNHMNTIGTMLDYGYFEGTYVALYRLNRLGHLYSVIANSYTDVWVWGVVPTAKTAQDAWDFHRVTPVMCF